MDDKKFDLKKNQLPEIEIPNETELGFDENYNEEEEVSAENGYDYDLEEDTQPETQEKVPQKEENNKEKKEEEKSEDGGSSEHDGKYFVIQKGKAKCNQGMKFPSF